MYKKQILKKAIDKATKNGYGDFKKIPMDSIDWEVLADDYYSLIFSHDFAKAFWGTDTYKWLYPDGIEKIAKGLFEETTIIQDWQYHLQQMVLEKDPLKYLEKYV